MHQPWSDKLVHTWRRHGSPARVIVVVSLLLVAAGVVWVASSAMSPKYEWLFGGRPFSPRERIRIEAAWAEAGCDDYQWEGPRVRFPRKEKARYLQALADAGAVPTDLERSTAQSPASGNPFESPEQRRARWQRHHEAELAGVIRAIDGVDDAFVRFDEVLQGGLRREKKITAMVAVRADDDQMLDPHIVYGIRQLIVGAKAGLTPHDVIITDMSSGIAFPVDPKMEQIVRQRNQIALLERQWAERLGRQLDIPGAQVQVRVIRNPVHSEPLASGLPHHGDRLQITVQVPDPFYRQAVQPETGRDRSPTKSSLATVSSQTRSQVERAVAAVVSTTAFDLTIARIGGDSAATVATGAGITLPEWRHPATLLMLAGVLAVAAWLARGMWVDLRQLGRKRSTAPPSTPSSTPSTDPPPHDPQPADEPFDHQLAQVVGDDPHAAAEVLDTWMRKAG